MDDKELLTFSPVENTGIEKTPTVDGTLGVPQQKKSIEKADGSLGESQQSEVRDHNLRSGGDGVDDPNDTDGSGTDVTGVAEALQGMKVAYRRPTPGEKRYLKRLRQRGVDTSKVKLGDRPPPKPSRSGATAIKVAPLRSTWLKKKPEERPGTSASMRTASSTPGRAVKRTTTDRETPEDKITKKSREDESSQSFKAALTGIRVSIIPGNYPEETMSEEEGNKFIRSFYTKSDISEGPLPTYEGVKWMGDHLGYICTDQGGIKFLRELAAEMKCGYRVVETKDLPPKAKVATCFPEEASNELIMQRLKKYNAGLDCTRWKFLKSRMDDKGYSVILAIDEKTKQLLANKQNRLHYMCGKVTFRHLEDKEHPATAETSQMETEAPTNETPGTQADDGAGAADKPAAC